MACCLVDRGDHYNGNFAGLLYTRYHIGYLSRHASRVWTVRRGANVAVDAEASAVRDRLCHVCRLAKGAQTDCEGWSEN